MSFHSGETCGEVVGEVEGGARAVGAMDVGDREIGQLEVRIELLDRRIVPLRDLAHVDLGDGRTVEHEFAGLHARDVDDHDDAAHHHRPLGEAVLVEVLRLQRRVGRAEGHGLGPDLLDAGARADRLIVEAVAGVLLIGVRPFGVDRERKGRPGAGNIRRAGDGDSADHRGCHDYGFEEHWGLSGGNESVPRPSGRTWAASLGRAGFITRHGPAYMTRGRKFCDSVSRTKTSRISSLSPSGGHSAGMALAS